MINDKSPINPLFASSTRAAISPSARTIKTATKLGGYGGMAVTAWLVGAVATGHGVATADTTGTTSTSSEVKTGETNNQPSAGPTTGTSTTPTIESALARVGTPLTPGVTRSGRTFSRSEVAPGVSVSGSRGPRASTVDLHAPTATSTGIDSVRSINGFVKKYFSDNLLDSGEAAEPAQVIAPPAAQAPDLKRSAAASAGIDSHGPRSTIVRALTARAAIDATSLTSSTRATSTIPQSSVTLTQPNVAAAATGLVANFARNATATAAAAVAPAAVAPTPQVASGVIGAVGFLNGIVTNLLKPFLAPAPNTPNPLTPVTWAVLGWVRRTLFNEAPTITSKPTAQTGQTVTGDIDGHDPEGDALTYTVTQGPQHGNLAFDQATGNYSYTPNDINYTGTQTDSFTVSVTDGKTNLLSLLGVPHTATKTIDITVQPPTIERVILNVPGIDKPWTPRYSADGKTIYFTGTPTGTARSELYRINSDGTGTSTCLSCGLSPDITVNLFKPVPTADGSGRILVQLETAKPTSVIYEPAGYNGNTAAKLVKIVPPPSTSFFAVSLLNEPRISPDGKHILYSRIELNNATGYIGEAVVVGDLVRSADGSQYDILNSVVVAGSGEGKNWTPDGKGITCLCGLNEAGNADNVVIDLATGDVTRLNGNLDYDEDMDLSPNEKWMAVGSLRGFDGLTPMSRITRPALLPTYIQGPVYYKYALNNPVGQPNISNQEWLVAVEDDLNGVNGIPLYALDDRWTARSMPSFNATGDAVTFWEYNIDNFDVNNQPTQYRLVVANLKYTTSVGTVQGDLQTPALSPTFPSLTGYVVKPPPLPAPGTYQGGTLKISEVADPNPTRAGYTLRTVTYTNYVNEDGMILNGTESTSSLPSLSKVYYLADVQVTGTHTGVLKGDATINLTTITGNIPDPDGLKDANGNVIMRSIYSTLDGKTLYLLDDARYQESLAHT